MLFIIIGMSLFYHFMAMESLTFTQCISLMVLFLVYVAVVIFQTMQ